ncbi:MAG: hypothetical protein N4A53_06545 [Pelagimonas sp.]|jgi:hypothetical protein|nr:hypothetical protein [Pelagimonas sp.]
MNNVVKLTVPSRILPMEARVTALLALFAAHRRTGEDVFWLKENAEILNILECTGLPVPQTALQVHEAFYENAEKRLQFFPQYYRFLLSLVLDMEALGMPGDMAQRMVDFANEQGLAKAELSDLQRAEACRLMSRRGVDPLRDRGLGDRLRNFINRSATFALPNKKAAYELTHIVFYLSEYGRVDPHLDAEACQSLHFAGLTAFLDENADLLAEICIAMRYAGEVPPAVWTAWLAQETAHFSADEGDFVSLNDDYHEFLICNWHHTIIGGEPFRVPLADGRVRFDRAARTGLALREISQAIMALEEQRSPDFDVMRRRMAPTLSEDSREMLEIAAASSSHFDAFFEGFARAGGA